jgi:SpoVK/Ycf46/Vps4 family AAA+-type ATPase
MQSGNKANVLDQMLTMLDGFEGRKQVFVMGATNRPGNGIRIICRGSNYFVCTTQNPG